MGNENKPVLIMNRRVCVLVTWASVFVCGWMILGTVYDDVSVSYGSTFVCLFCMQMSLEVSLITSCIIVLRVWLQWVEAGCGVCVLWCVFLTLRWPLWPADMNACASGFLTHSHSDVKNDLKALQVWIPESEAMEVTHSH